MFCSFSLFRASVMRATRRVPAVVSRGMAQSQSRGTNTDTMYYVAAVGVIAVGVSYAAVPLYRLFCQVTFLHRCSRPCVFPFLLVSQEPCS
jgi:hypothetical protein